ncbi:MAG: phage portal protein [Hyphomonas sp.]|uniref:phage portal protein n=1 Tax=Hyphomonas sp. TaxID=87 RepID=UPI0025C6F19E|nr:phage portal protein [Hyphomonas sp.]MBA4338326.1 phage portal protein [Hyphomonas sp.]
MRVSRIFGTVRGLFSRGGKLGAFFSGTSEAGEAITYDRVLSLGAAYACARTLAESVSCLPFMMYTVEPGGVSKPAPDHALSDLLGDQPNADQPAQQFWEMVILQLALRGNHYSLIHRLGGKITALEPLPPHPETICERNASGAREFVVSSGPRAGRHAEADVFFIPGFGDNIDCGLSIIGAGRNTFGRMLSLEKHQSKLLAKGVRPNMVMTTPGVLTEENRALTKKNLIEPFVGSDNAGGMMLLEGGFEVKPVTMTSADAQLVEQAKLGVPEICRLFGVPPWLIGHSDGDSNWGTGLEQQFRAFGTVTLKPYTKRIVGEVRRQLMSRDERKKFRPAFDLEALYEGDTLTMRRADDIDIRAGVLTRNEVRAKRGRAPLPGGDVAVQQAQMVPIVFDPNQGGGNAPQD